MVRMKLYGLILVTLALVSCSGHSARVDDGSITLMPANDTPAQTGENQGSEIPLLPQDDYVSPELIVSRRGSIAAEVHLKGNQHFLVPEFNLQVQHRV